MKTRNDLTRLRSYRTCLISGLFLLSYVVSPAQPLERNPQPSSPNWRQGKDIVSRAFPKEYTKEAKKLIDSLAIWTARSFNRIGGLSASGSTIEWHAIYLPKPESPPNVASYELKASIPVDAGTGVLTIAANDMSQSGQPLLLNGHYRWLIGSLEQKDSGIYTTEWKCADEDSTQKPKVVKAWLICFRDSVPYAVVDRREYFEDAIKELNALKDSVKQQISLETHGRNAQQEEAFRKSELQAIDNSFTGNDRLQRERDFLLIYKPDSVFQNDTLNVRAASIIEKTELIKSLLESLKELHKPAFVSAPALAFEGLEDGLPGARMLIRPRPGYFRNNIAPERPQFLVLSWQYDPDNASAAALGEKIGKELDLPELRDILQQVRPFYIPVKKDRR